MKLASKRLQALRFISPLGDEGAHYEAAYARMAKSWSAFAENFHEESVSYLPSHDSRAVVSDPLQYLGGPLRYTAHASDFDGFARQILDLAEALARTGANPRESGGGLPAVVEPPLLRMELSVPGDGKQPRVRSVGADPTVRHKLEFPLDLPPEATSLNLRILCEPGILEITGFSLVHPGQPPVETAFDAEALRKNLRVISDAAVHHADHVFRLLISREPAVLVFQNWRNDTLPSPSALRMEMRYEDRLERSIFLHPAALNAMNRDSAAREVSARKQQLLLDHAKYAAGSVIDFSDAGDAVLFTQSGWCNPEPWGTWTEGHEAALKICLDQIPQRDATLTASVRALVNRSHRSVQCDIHINGEKLAAWTLTNAEFKQFRVKIPAGKIPSRDCAITFKIRDPRSPEQLGISTDKRLLGLGFGDMDLQW